MLTEFSTASSPQSPLRKTFAENIFIKETLWSKETDRLTNISGTFLQSISGIPFNTANDLWVSFQKTFSSYVNSHGGSANIVSPSILRPNWDKVRAVMNRTLPLSSLP